MTDGVNTLDVAAIRARCDKATPGPWYCTGPVGQVMTGQWVAIADTWYEQPTENWEHNVAFIAAARTDVPALLDALAATEAENARLQRRLVESAAQLLFERRARKEEHKPGGQRQQYWSNLHESRHDYWRAQAKRQLAALGEAAPATREE